MRRIITRIALLASVLAAAAPARALTPAHFWSHGLGSSSTDKGTSVAVDPSGNVYAAGTFTGTIDLGGGDLVSAGDYDAFLAKFDRFGVHQWSIRFGSTGADACNSVCVDNGVLVITGYFNGTVNFGGTDLISAGGADIFVARYSLAGAHSWSARFGSTLSDVGNGVAVDDFFNVIFTGYFSGTVSFGGSNLVSAGNTDIFLAKLNSGGTHQWSQRFGSASLERGNALAVAGADNVIITGYFQQTVSFGGSNLVSAGNSDVYLAKYNSAGTHQWSQRFGSTSIDDAKSVAVDASDNVLLSGSFNGTVNFGGSNLVSAGSADIFFAKYNSSGVHLLSKRFGNVNSDVAAAIAADASGNIFMTGFFNGTVDFGGGNLVTPGAVGQTDVFLARYTSAGAHVWSGRFGSTASEDGTAIAVDASGSVVITGEFGGTVDFGGGPIDAVGGLDVFLAKYNAEAPEEPVITSIVDIGNDQGRKVRIAFRSSGTDHVQAGLPVVRYDAFRRTDPAPSMTATGDDLPADALLNLGWVQVASVNAYGESDYAVEAPTIGDSTVALGQYRSVFYIRAATDVPTLFFDSPADSGYSLDNLAPSVPQNFVYTAGDLSWTESSAADFDYFTVYGSNTGAFGAATVVNYSVVPELDVNASPYVFYFVTATDFSGNEGKPAKVNTLSGVGGSPKSYVLSVSNYPNPFNPRTTVSYTIPSRGSVTVSVYDARGAHVATLFNGERGPGAYTIEWDGLANGSAVSSGVYFARIEHASGTRSKKMVLLK